MKPKIVVVGSANTDFVLQTPHLPSAGETVLGDGFQVVRGGKGANQAVAAARLGGEVTFVARLGADDFGRSAVQAYQEEGICTDFIHLEETQPSGVALILVNPQGQNIIAVAPGANSRLSPDDVWEAESVIRGADAVLLQLETPTASVRAAIDVAHRHGVRVILNPAPAQTLPVEFYQGVDILTPNETEAAILAGPAFPVEEDVSFTRLAARLPVPVLLVTLGAQGVRLVSSAHSVHIPAFQVRAVDATAAGDAFNGALAVALGEGQDLLEAVRFASAAGGLAASQPGAQPSLPTREAVDSLLASR